MGARGGGALRSFLLLLVSFSAAALPSNCSSSRSSSVLVALLDSPYTELAELVEKALLLPDLEALVGRHNLTVFAPRNEALHPELRRFLLQPGNLPSLRALLLSHLLPLRLPSAAWPSGGAAVPLPSLNPSHRLVLRRRRRRVLLVDFAAVVLPDAFLLPDGVIHGLDRLLVPLSVQQAFNRRRRSIAAVLPAPAPSFPPPLPSQPPAAMLISSSTSAAAAAVVVVAPAPAPAPGPAEGGGDWWSGRQRVRSFIEALVQYGGYGEMADVLVNLTAVAAEMGRLVAEGYVLTVLAPSDEAMGRVAGDRLSSPEKMVYYHLIAEYQTEESMYAAVRRWGKVSYETLRVPHRLAAREADGSVKFGGGDGMYAYLVDPDIYTDGRISVQGIDAVLSPPPEAEPEPPAAAAKPAVKARRGRLLEAACGVWGAVGRRWSFSACR